MKRILFAATALAAVGYSHGRTETVTVTRKGSKDAVRVNKSDYDADQEGDKTMTLHKSTEDAATGGARSDVNATNAGGVITTAAPSAPDFSGGEGNSLPMDETKAAVAPTSTTADQLLVMKSGNGKSAKFFITDGMGQKITGDQAKLLGIDESGYDTEEAAKTVQSNTEPSKAQ